MQRTKHVTNRPLKNRQEITNVQCFAKNKYICQELEEFSSLVVVIFSFS